MDRLRVVVVGGGVLGCMHALTALRAGADVVLVEREDAARGASLRNFGLIWVSGRVGGDELSLTLRSRTLWARIGSSIQELGFRANGSLTIAQSDVERRVLEEAAARSDATDRGFSLLDSAAVRALNPAIRGDVVAGLHCVLDAAVEPRLVPAALRSAMEREGGGRFSFLAGRQVVEMGDGWVRDHTGDRHEGDLAIVCAGANHRGIAGWMPFDGALRRVRLQMLETAPAPYSVTTSIADGNSLRYYPVFDLPARADLPPASPLVEQHHIQLLLQQRLDGSLTVGDTHVYDEPFDFATLEEPYAHLQARAESILGRPLPTIRRRWAGVYSQAPPEMLFHCERVRKRTVVVTGAGGRGMTLAPAIAERVLTRLGVLEPHELTVAS